MSGTNPSPFTRIARDAFGNLRPDRRRRRVPRGGGIISHLTQPFQTNEDAGERALRILAIAQEEARNNPFQLNYPNPLRRRGSEPALGGSPQWFLESPTDSPARSEGEPRARQRGGRRSPTLRQVARRERRSGSLLTPSGGLQVLNTNARGMQRLHRDTTHFQTSDPHGSALRRFAGVDTPRREQVQGLVEGRMMAQLARQLAEERELDQALGVAAHPTTPSRPLLTPMAATPGLVPEPPDPTDTVRRDPTVTVRRTPPPTPATPDTQEIFRTVHRGQTRQVDPQQIGAATWTPRGRPQSDKPTFDTTPLGTAMDFGKETPDEEKSEPGVLSPSAVHQTMTPGQHPGGSQGIGDFPAGFQPVSEQPQYEPPSVPDGGLQSPYAVPLRRDPVTPLTVRPTTTTTPGSAVTASIPPSPQSRLPPPPTPQTERRTREALREAERRRLADLEDAARQLQQPGGSGAMQPRGGGAMTRQQRQIEARASARKEEERQRLERERERRRIRIEHPPPRPPPSPQYSGGPQFQQYGDPALLGNQGGGGLAGPPGGSQAGGQQPQEHGGGQQAGGQPQQAGGGPPHAGGLGGPPPGPDGGGGPPEDFGGGG